MTPWKTKRFGSSGKATIPLQRRMFAPSRWVRSLIHGNELLGVHLAKAHRDRLHVLVVEVLQPAMVMMVVVAARAALVVVIMIVVVMPIILLQEGGLDLQDAVEIEGVATEHRIERNRGALRAVQCGIGVDRPIRPSTSASSCGRRGRSC